jgi:hypothetical protein
VGFAQSGALARKAYVFLRKYQTMVKPMRLITKYILANHEI